MNNSQKENMVKQINTMLPFDQDAKNNHFGSMRVFKNDPGKFDPTFVAIAKEIAPLV